MNSTFRALLLSVVATLLCQCSTAVKRTGDVVVSVADQKLGVYDKEGHLVSSYKISTSKFGVGDKPGSCCTPLGKHQVVAKIGHGLPSGAVLKSREWNGEVVKPNAPGRDPIVSRILWLSGMENSNRNAFNRCIYIHGTAEENRLGVPASYGCVRMAAKDVIRIFEQVPIGATVMITNSNLPRAETAAVPAATAPQPVQEVRAAAPANLAATPAKTQRKEPQQDAGTSKRQKLQLSVQS